MREGGEDKWGRWIEGEGRKEGEGERVGKIAEESGEGGEDEQERWIEGEGEERGEGGYNMEG